MTDSLEIQARRNPAGLSPAKLARAAYGPFCDAVRRLGCLTPTQRLLAWLLAQATLKQGYTSLAFSSLTELTQVRPHAKPFAGLAKNDLSPALNALKAHGLVRLEERATLESGVPPVTLLLVIADAMQWAVPADAWLFSEAEERELMVHLQACRQRWTAQLPELAESADLHDARAAVAVEAVASNALVVSDERDRSACRVGAFVGPTVDAREVCRTKAMTCDGRGRSGSRNAETPAKAGCVLKVGTPLRLKTEVISKELKINLKGCSQDGLKAALLTLELSANDDEVRAAIKVIIGEEAGQRDAGKWIVRRWTNRQQVHEVFCDVVDRLTRLNLPKVGHPGGLAESYWKKSKESFSTT